MHIKTKKSQRGFTLVEIAVVLVIIGLLLGGVLKGQELINSARVKALSQDFRNVPTLLYAYQDKFRALPGDDKSAATHVNASALNGNGNGRLEGDWNTASADDEACKFWQHLRLAGMLAGTDALTAGGACSIQPQNASGGTMGIETAFTGHNAYISGMKGVYLCSDAIQGRYVRQLDQTMDNGDSATGSMRAVAYAGGGLPARGTAAVATTALVDSDPYVVCLEI
ncbi:MAG: prepilin-type N-terminal cleavage/methylation domain-containing protein [Rhodocyclaceae bacterium]|nr:prepilin-type N-terminal cleavage/methylation domain-containing protein [Rhodocyclaceae bacterium]